MLDLDFAEEGKIQLHVRKFLLYPKYWEDTNNHVSFDQSWRFIKFKASNLRKVPDSKGVYCFVVKPKIPNFFETRYLFYAGQTTNTLRDRYRNYIDEGLGKGKPRIKVYRMLNLYKNHIYFYYAVIDNDSHIKNSEDSLLNMFVPQVNVQIPNAKIKPELKYLYEG